MTNQQIVDAIQATMEEMRNAAHIPFNTGNMAFNALDISITKNEVVVFFNEEEAPYIPYTNEPWISPYWRRKKNPNEGWWQRFVEEFTRRLAQKLGGTIK